MGIGDWGLGLQLFKIYLAYFKFFKLHQNLRIIKL